MPDSTRATRQYSRNHESVYGGRGWGVSPPCPQPLNRREVEILFNNTHIHDYPQAHEIESGLPIDELILQTGMVVSRSQLKRLYQQGGVHIEDRPDLKGVIKQLRIGQRRLLITGGK